MNKQAYINKETHIDGNWFAARGYLENLKHTIRAELCETTSSAGDWSGLFVQKFGRKYYVIPFNQENSWPGAGFTLYTGEVLVEMIEEPTQEALYKIWDLGGGYTEEDDIKQPQGEN